MAYLKQVPVGPMQNFAYLLGPDAGAECAVVDPGWDAAGLLAAAQADGRRIVCAVLTHGHFDHAGGLKDLLQAGHLPIYAHEGDARALAAQLPGVKPVRDGEKLLLAGLEAEVLHTPGHTPGSMCLLAAGNLLTGDTLFVDCCGRTDLPGSDPSAMHASLRRLAALPKDTVVWPGHDYGDRPSGPLGDLLKINPYLAAATLDEFLRLQG